MKKTVAVMLSLASLATAAELGEALTLSVSVKDSENGLEPVSALQHMQENNGNYNYSGYGNYTANQGGSISFTLNVAEMLQNPAVTLTAGQYFSLTSFSYLSFVDSYGGTYLDAASGERKITITTGNDGEHSSVSAWITTANLSPNKKVVTVTFGDELRFTDTDELTVTLASARTDRGVGIGYLDYKNQTAEFAGTSTLLDGSGNKVQTSWRNNIVAADMSVVVAPEPATATLSLLALVGLASRRRRH